MKRLLESVQTLKTEEYGRAVEKFGPVNASAHESYGVLKEEVEEAQDELNLVNRYLNTYWEGVKKDLPYSMQYNALIDIERCASCLACEAIQVAAMAHKAILTLKPVEE